MITPSFNITATERVLPKLALDFTTASLDSRITFTRALNTATRINSSGLIETVNADIARFDYDPITFACKGLLIEESRINLLTYSEQFNDVSWADAGDIVRTADAAVSPSGLTNADKIAAAASNNVHGLQKVSVSVTNGATYTFSCYAKKAGYDYLWFDLFDGTNRRTYFNLSNGTVGTNAAGSTASIVNMGNGWYRCVISRAVASTSVNAAILVSPSDNTPAFLGDGTSGAYFWGAQLEAGAFPTSYIPTTTTSLTRNADVATMTGTNFSDWFNASEGTFVYQGYASPQAPAVYLSAHSGAVADSFFFDNDSGNIRNVVFSGGAPVAVLSTGTIGTPGNALKLVGAYKVDDFAAVKNNETLAQDLAGAVPVGLNTLVLGGWGSVANAQVNSWVAKVSYYPQRLLNAEMQALSK